MSELGKEYRREIEALQARVDALTAENTQLVKIISQAYARLGFTGHKNETMRILGKGLPKARDKAALREDEDGT